MHCNTHTTKTQLHPNIEGSMLVMACESIMVTAAAETPFSSVSPVIEFPNGTTVFKIFSAAPLSTGLLARMFGDVQLSAVHDWLAYPKFDPPEKFSPFVLAPGLFYNNALENAASAMEMSAVAAANNALLASNYLNSRSHCDVANVQVDGKEILGLRKMH